MEHPGDSTSVRKNPLIYAGGKPASMSSREIADLLDVRHDSVKRTIERLADKGHIRFSPSVETSHEGAGARPVEVYLVNERDSYVTVAQLSPEFTARLVDYWQAHRNTSPRLPTTAEAFAEVFRMAAEAERLQAEQTAAIAHVVERVEIVEQTAPLKAKPQNAETRSEARKRMNRVHGLSEAIVDTVLDHAGYGIRPFAMVKNSHEDAQGSSYGVYWIRDISALFKRFASECTSHSATMVRHPIISRPFKLAK